MPSKTFFNLSQEKREKLLTASRAEFVRVPYDQVSINRIIQAAKIPRGSFYMYFTDKEDLFRFLMQEYLERFSTLLVDTLKQEKGDLFAMFRRILDHTLDYRAGHTTDVQLDGLAQMLQRNMGMRNTEIFSMFCAGDQLSRLIQYIDTSELDLTAPEDLTDMLHILFCVSVPFLLQCGHHTEDSQLRRRFHNTLEILKHGLVKQPAQPHLS